MNFEQWREWFDTHRTLVVTSAAGGIGVIIVAALLLSGGWASDEVTSQEPQTAYATTADAFTTPEATKMEETSSTVETKQTTPTPWMVDIKGAVKEPTLYKVSEGDRVYDVIERASGLLETADRNRINFSLKVQDQMVIYIPKKGEDIPEGLAGTQAASMNSTASGSSEGNATVNVNQATKEELMTVSGIGEKKAQDIIDYRESNGPFQQIDELINVSGIGEKTLEKLRDQLTV